MMRSLFSGVAGLKTHQTRMDVIGNNIANVNTTAYKSQNMVFSDLLYQTTQAASGANGTTGRGGINPRQIGLGAKTGAISTAITTQGSAQSTNNPWDIMLEGDAFFVVNDGNQNFFTRDGSFTVDGAGNLVMANTGYLVMGWQVNPETGDIQKDVVSALQVMNVDNLTSPPEATTRGYVTGILDKTDTDIHSTKGAVRNLTFFDAQGYKYSAQLSFHATDNEDRYRVQLDDIWDEKGVSLVKKYGLNNIEQIATFGGENTTEKTSLYTLDPKVATYDNATKTYNVIVSNDKMLTGWSTNPLLVGADEVNIKTIGGTSLDPAPTTPIDVTEGTDVVVGAKITLTKDVLESEPYNLIFSNNNYEQNGDIIDDPADTNFAKWQAALAEMFKNQDGSTNALANFKVSQGAKDSERVIEFDVTLKASQAASYSKGSFGTTLTVGTDNEKILEQVFQIEGGDGKTYTLSDVGSNGNAQITVTETTKGTMLVFDHDTAKFSYIGSQGSDTAMLTFKDSASSTSGDTVQLTQFSDIEIDFSSVTSYGNGGKTTLEFTNGSKDSSATGAGRKEGELIGIEVGQDGRITASYDNGLTKLLGQIAVAEFANAAGLSKAGNNLYSTTMNSGEFDGVGKDVTESGGSMTSGVLEMSNVDLSSEFTTMITTQRGFQANSRIITTSDTLLEELVNLKR